MRFARANSGVIHSGDNGGGIGLLYFLSNGRFPALVYLNRLELRWYMGELASLSVRCSRDACKG